MSLSPGSPSIFPQKPPGIPPEKEILPSFAFISGFFNQRDITEEPVKNLLLLRHLYHI